MEIELSTHPSYEPKQKQLQAELNTQRIFRQQKYRWVIVFLMGISLILNGVANNAIIPLQQKISVVYELSKMKVTLSIVLSFLTFTIMNFPANHIIDTKGLRMSFLIGTGCFTLGTFLYTLINKSYYFVILGTIIFGIGQPFLLNCPAKVATFWFLPKNRALATSFMIGLNLLGMGLGFLIPTLFVEETSTGEDAKKEIAHLYIAYFIFSTICLALNFVFMRKKPSKAPSKGAEAEKLSPSQSIKLMKSDKNLWKFFIGYCLIYGTFIAFASNSNFIIKPFGYTDFQIAINGIFLMVIGTIGAILFSLYIKKSFNYKRALRIISLGSTTMLLIFCLWMLTVNQKFISTVIISVLGFMITPIVPVSYDLGCELAFPIGQAQVTGLLNGGAFLWAFLSSSFVTSVIGSGTKKQSMITLVSLSTSILAGTILFFLLKINLKRSQFQKEKDKTEKKQDLTQNTEQQQNKTDVDNGQTVKQKYQTLVEENQNGFQLIAL